MLAETERWGAQVTEPLGNMLNQILNYVPVLLGALLVLIVGWLIAKAIRRLAEWLLKTIHFEAVADKAGVTELLKKGDLTMNTSQILAALIYWLIMIIVLVMVVDALGLPDATALLGTLFAYIPSVIAAVVVLVVAMFLGGFVSDIVRTAAANAKMPRPELLAAISRWAIIIFAATIALAQLGIAPHLVAATFHIILGGIVLAVSLAFGLGGREAAGRYIDQLQEDRRQKQGKG